VINPSFHQEGKRSIAKNEFPRQQIPFFRHNFLFYPTKIIFFKPEGNYSSTQPLAAHFSGIKRWLVFM
jgi:hypothetical protein